MSSLSKVVATQPGLRRLVGTHSPSECGIGLQPFSRPAGSRSDTKPLKSKPHGVPTPQAQDQGLESHPDPAHRPVARKARWLQGLQQELIQRTSRRTGFSYFLLTRFGTFCSMVICYQARAAWEGREEASFADNLHYFAVTCGRRCEISHLGGRIRRFLVGGNQACRDLLELLWS